MNTAVSTWLWSESPLAPVRLAKVETLFVQAEAELSRFKPTSGLSRLNAQAGAGRRRFRRCSWVCSVQRWMQPPPAMGSLTPLCDRLTSSRLRSQLRELASGDGKTGAKMKTEPHRLASATAGQARRTAELPAGLGIDLGGIAKGWTVDRAAEMLGSWAAALVDAGGDLRATAPPAASHGP